MLTVTGRAIAQTRAATMRRFLGELAGEIGAAPPDHWPGA